MQRSNPTVVRPASSLRALVASALLSMIGLPIGNAQTQLSTDRPNSAIPSRNMDSNLDESLAREIKEESQRPIRSSKNVIFREIDGAKITADWFRPDHDQICPLVIMIHGGGWISGDKWDLRDHARELAQAGFAVCSINYRLAPKVKMWNQMDDVRFAANWACLQAETWGADPSHAAIWGYSAGAQLGSLLALMPEAALHKYLDDKVEDHATNLLHVRAVVAGGAPCDFEFVPESSFILAPVLGGTRARKPEVYRDFSPIKYVSRDTARKSPSYFLFHGTRDALVPLSTSRRMYEKLQSVGVTAEYHLVEGKGHLFSFLDLKVRRLAIQFLRQQLSPDHESPHSTPLTPIQDKH